MKRNFVVSAMIAVAALGQTANAGTLRSVYTETRSCPVTEEGEDAFTRECSGPGNIKAILQYVDGLFGVFYTPTANEVPMERSDMVEVSPNARLPYGAKHEWRIRDGETKPCAGIIRAFATGGERLIVTDLSTGKRIGEVKSNSQATALADKACSAPVALAPQAAAVPPASSSSGDDNEDVATAVSRGKDMFSQTYRETGISGVIEKIEACYQNVDQKASPYLLATCAAMDIVGANVDSEMTRQFPNLGQPFFSGTNPDERIAVGMKKLKLDEQQRKDFEHQLAGALQIRLTEVSDAPQNQPKSVFDFSK